MKIFSIFVMLYMAWTNPCRAIETLSDEESAIFNQFFYLLLRDTEGGYVFEEKKPLCITNFPLNNTFSLIGNRHNPFLVSIKEASPICRKIYSRKNEVFIYFYENFSFSNYACALIIHQPLLLKTIEKNLTLFQYVLGPKTTPQGLLELLISKNNTFYSVLKNDKNLIGIILGYGTQNALHASRMENIQEWWMNQDVPPFLARQKSVPPSFRDGLLFIPAGGEDSESNPSLLYPSFGFSSLEEEFNALADEIAAPPESLMKNAPTLIFGHVKGDTEIAFEGLENAQKDIQKILQSPMLLEGELTEFLSQNGYTPSSSYAARLSFNDKVAADLPAIVARSIWQSLDGETYRSAVVKNLISGKDFLLDNDSRKCLLHGSFNYNFPEITDNLAEANSTFQKLRLDPKLACVVPEKLFFQITKSGSGKALNNEAVVSLEYRIFDPRGQCLSETLSASVNLKDLIPGFAHGIKGMHEGETREIWIHPSLAYGAHTLLQKAIYLKAIVTLRHIEASSNAPYPEISFLDLSFVSSPEFQKSKEYIEKNYLKDKAQEYAGQIAQHLQKNKDVRIDDVYKYLQALQEGKASFVDLSEEEEIAMNRFHWNIYFASS